MIVWQMVVLKDLFYNVKFLIILQGETYEVIIYKNAS